MDCVKVRLISVQITTQLNGSNFAINFLMGYKKCKAKGNLVKLLYMFDQNSIMQSNTFFYIQIRQQMFK
jgi:hypothetical protein